MEKPQSLKAVLTEEGIWKSDCLNSLHLRIFKEIRIYEKENRHIHLFSCIQFLLCFYFLLATWLQPITIIISEPTFKAKTLYLWKIRRHLSRGYAICSNTNDILLTQVLGLIECQSRLARKHPDLALLRGEFPLKHIGDRGIEGNTETFSLSLWDQLFGGESGLVRYGSTAKAGTLADGTVERDRGIGKCQSDNSETESDRFI